MNTAKLMNWILPAVSICLILVAITLMILSIVQPAPNGQLSLEEAIVLYGDGPAEWLDMLAPNSFIIAIKDVGS